MEKTGHYHSHYDLNTKDTHLSVKIEHVGAEVILINAHRVS